jgi:hypothetical protein
MIDIWEICDELIIVSIQQSKLQQLIGIMKIRVIDFRVIPKFSLNSKFLEQIKTICKGTYSCVLLKFFRAMLNADHIHLRCPKTVIMGLLGCFIQISFLQN